MSYYFIIIRQTTELLINYEEYLATAEKLLTNPHIHIILKSNLSIQTLRKQIQKLYPLKKQVSIKNVKDLDKSICYILKEGNVLKNTLIEDLEPYLEKVKEIQLQIKEDKSNYSRYVILKYEPLEVYKIDYYCVYHHITVFLSEMFRNDFKPFDTIIKRRLLNAIINYHYPQCQQVLDYLDKPPQTVENFKFET